MDFSQKTPDPPGVIMSSPESLEVEKMASARRERGGGVNGSRVGAIIPTADSPRNCPPENQEPDII
jgi:hypothetical protein